MASASSSACIEQDPLQPPRKRARLLHGVSQECFCDDNWIRRFAPHGLTRDECHPSFALRYFATSGFYDPECNNEKIWAQQLDPKALLQMTGIEYALMEEERPGLFVVSKQRRESPEMVEKLAIYYILNNVVYQAPNLRALFESRMLKCLFYVERAMKSLGSHVRYAPNQGYTWDFPGDHQKWWGQSREHALFEDRRTKKLDEKIRNNARRVDLILNALTKRFRPEHLTKSLCTSVRIAQ